MRIHIARQIRPKVCTFTKSIGRCYQRAAFSQGQSTLCGRNVCGSLRTTVTQYGLSALLKIPTPSCSRSTDIDATALCVYILFKQKPLRKGTTRAFWDRSAENNNTTCPPLCRGRRCARPALVASPANTARTNLAHAYLAL